MELLRIDMQVTTGVTDRHMVLIFLPVSVDPHSLTKQLTSTQSHGKRSRGLSWRVCTLPAVYLF